MQEKNVGKKWRYDFRLSGLREQAHSPRRGRFSDIPLGASFQSRAKDSSRGAGETGGEFR